MTSRVLVMEYLSGSKLDDIHGVVFTETDGPELAKELFRGYLHQVLVDGTFHADPHPGNVLLTAEHQIALLDVGMVGHIHQGMQRDLIKLLLALSEARTDDAIQAALRIADQRQDADVAGFRHEIQRLLAQNHQAKLSGIKLGQILMKVCRVAAEQGVLMPPSLSVLAKTRLNLEQIGLQLDPNFDPHQAIRDYTAPLLQKHLRKDASPGSLLGGLLEAKEFAEALPGRANQIMDLVANNRLKLSVDAIDEELLLTGIEKIANRITAGLILAALIIGAALMMRIETSFTILGYPGIAMLFFVVAVLGGFLLIYRVLTGDGSRRPR